MTNFFLLIIERMCLFFVNLFYITKDLILNYNVSCFVCKWLIKLVPFLIMYNKVEENPGSTVEFFR